MKQVDGRPLRIGVVGYSGKKFDTGKARRLLIKALHPYLKRKDVELVSGLTDIGVPAIAYRLAKEQDWDTVGIACSLARDYPMYPVTRTRIVGTMWGDESAAFLANIDVLIRIGGGQQSYDETHKAQQMGLTVIEHDLESL